VAFGRGIGDLEVPVLGFAETEEDFEARKVWDEHTEFLFGRLFLNYSRGAEFVILDGNLGKVNDLIVKNLEHFTNKRLIIVFQYIRLPSSKSKIDSRTPDTTYPIGTGPSVRHSRPPKLQNPDTTIQQRPRNSGTKNSKSHGKLSVIIWPTSVTSLPPPIPKRGI
jgi:hypothetical protein